MLVTLVALLCRLATGACVEVIITDQATFERCIIHGQIGVAAWMAMNPTYSTGWSVTRVKCVIGPYKEATPT